MGFNVSIKFEGVWEDYEIGDLTVQESSTPLAAGDSSGAVGTFDFSIPMPDKWVHPNNKVNKFGVTYLVGSEVRFTDSRRGTSAGTILSVSRNSGEGILNISCLSKLNKLNAYNIQAPPHVGTITTAFKSYVALADPTLSVVVHPAIASIPVNFIGWEGELWYNLKQMCAAYELDLVLIGDNILLRPVRGRIATHALSTERSSVMGGGSLAQSVEVYSYNTSAIYNKAVYPPNGWNSEVAIITVNADEVIEEVIELESSLSYVKQPKVVDSVTRYFNTDSVYSVVGDDGITITADNWSKNGGSISAVINPDTISLTLTIAAPTGRIYNTDTGDNVKTFSIAMAADVSNSSYSSLRLIGTGVAFRKELVMAYTGLTNKETGTDVGVTVDNPFVTDNNIAARTAQWAAKEYDGNSVTLGGAVVTTNPVSSIANVPTIPEQLHGNVAGARLWDEETRRWYRIRDASYNTDSISYEAVDDQTFTDFEEFYRNMTFAQFDAMFSILNYNQLETLGLRFV